MLLAFDIGNSNTVLGVFKGKELLTYWRIETDSNKSADEYGMIVRQLFKYEGLKMEDIDDVIIATVVPSVLYTVRHMAQKYFGKDAIVVESGIKTGLIIKYDNPKQVGADRIVNAVAAFSKYGGPLIIIDLGGRSHRDLKFRQTLFLKKHPSSRKLNWKTRGTRSAEIQLKACSPGWFTVTWAWLNSSLRGCGRS